MSRRFAPRAATRSGSCPVCDQRYRLRTEDTGSRVLVDHPNGSLLCGGSGMTPVPPATREAS